MPALTAVETAEDFAKYGIDLDRGFLPAADPLTTFDYDRFVGEDASYLEELDALAADIPDLIDDGRLRWELNHLAAPDDGLYDAMTDPELFRLYQASSFLASAHVHNPYGEAVDRVPAGVARPLERSARLLDVPPIMSYDAYSLHNWTRRDPDGPIAVDNLDTIHNFVDITDGERNDESWFMLIHVEIEQEAADALTALPAAARGIAADDTTAVYDALRDIDGALDDVAGTMDRMAEENSPANYGDVQDADSVGYRWAIEGFDDIVYDGTPLDGPRSFRGETGAQSTIFPALDRAFGVPHETSALTAHVGEMVDYMPRRHRAYLRAVDDAPGITDYVRTVDDDDLAQVHDDAMTTMIGFRILHRLFAYEYIEEPTGKQEGTGGTFYPDFLEDFIEECEEQLVLKESKQPHWTGYLQETFDGMPVSMQQLRG